MWRIENTFLVWFYFAWHYFSWFLKHSQLLINVCNFNNLLYKCYITITNT